MREVPKAPPTKRGQKRTRGQGNDLGYGNNGGDAWVIRSETRTRQRASAVHRLDGGGSKGLRYSQLPLERVPETQGE